jgi:hypothetical protein
MIILKEFPEMQFESKEAAFKHLRENASKIIALKCAEIHKSCEKGYNFNGFIQLNEQKKALDFLKDNYIHAAINTTKYFDSHGDVHLDSIWNKTAKEQNGKTYYVSDHDLKLNSVIAYPKDVTIAIREVEWKDLGKPYEGKTTVLFFDVAKEKIVNRQAKEAIESGEPFQNSIRMQYIDIKLAMNSEEKEDIEYKKRFDEIYPIIANKEAVDEVGYFWAVSEAKIIKEGSMVLFGSNDATPILQSEAACGTSSKIEPPKGTHTEQKSIFSNLNLIK